MGSAVSRPRLSQVAPCPSPPDGDQEQKPNHSTLQWTIPAVSTPLKPQDGSLGCRRINQLPPLKLDNPATFPPLYAESSSVPSALPQSQRNIWSPSIIHSHPPRRLQALQPLAPLSAGLQVTANHTAMGRDWRDGHVLHFTAPSQAERGGASRQLQGGLLEAQMVLCQQAQRRRRSHYRRMREQRLHETNIRTDNVGRHSKGIQRLHLLNRPTQRDIFWDEMTGESLDLREILLPSPVPPEQEERRQSPSGPQPQLLGRVDELTNSDLACEGQKTMTVTGREAEGKDGGQSMKKTLPWMLDWRKEKHSEPIPNHLTFWEESARTSRWEARPLGGSQREGVRGLCHVEREILEPEMDQDLLSNLN
ncbi:uncharacterized protein LOC105026462 [Esox lucius]|uniref:uncharacterized protein LOC105026462 n=1 Tax=Esox lucius TaxID=8010 RepID=UPI000973395C|nr:uncharacterized protein LOC105026462 [Esox lucius]XP_019909603.1 uncharacterized protein LOC105026462 [Esox lucius]XP_019909604.1 uncharacterized protein LOC105026462 [Esox lucius]XP_034153468.1 uncharacterized protein LOC105026462 [Esox lucius]